jgi:hypothetical protein
MIEAVYIWTMICTPPAVLLGVVYVLKRMAQ